MKSMSKWLVALALVVLATNAFAVQAGPRLITFTQPDGSTFVGTMKGDELFGFAETKGFSVIQDNNGWWTYAQLKEGLLVFSDAKVGKDAPPYKEHLRPNADAILNLPQNKARIPGNLGDLRHARSTDMLYGAGGTKDKATLSSKYPSGKRMVNILLANFTDSTFSYFAGKTNPPSWPPMPKDVYRHCLAIALGDRDSAKPILYDSTTVPSLSNYYYDMSLNKMYFAGDYPAVGQIAGVDTVRMTTYSYATANSNTVGYMTAAINNADPYVNFRDPASGTQTALGIVHPGPCETESGRTGDIWSSNYFGLNIATGDGISIATMFVVPQGVMLGVFAHECCHNLGAPDLYDYGYSGTPWGMWSLMDMGSYGGPGQGDQPTFIGGHLMYDLDGNLTNGIDGWLTAGAVGNTDSISSLYRGDGEYTVATIDSAGERRVTGTITSGIRLWRIRNNNFRDSSQIFFVENRRNNPPYESGLPEEGILITHIDTRMYGGVVNFNGGPPCVKNYYSWVESPGSDPNLVYVTGDSVFYRDEDGACYSADDFVYNGYSQTALDSTTSPNSWINDGPTTTNKTGPFIYNVSAEGSYMNFNVLRTGMVSAKPVVGYVSSTVKDQLYNNNSLLDPWETDSLYITFKNYVTAITAGAACSLYVTVNSQYVTITNPGWKVIGTGALATGAQATTTTPFILAISKDAPRFTTVTFAAKIRSTTPAYTDTAYFNQQLAPLGVVQTYDFTNILVGGGKIQPSDLTTYGDTLIVANANIDLAQTRIYKVKRVVSTPMVAADTFGSISNNPGLTNKANYICGMDIDNSGNLWYTMEDTVWNSNRGTTLIRKFEGPNCDWAGATYMKRMRGLAFGPSQVDTVGADMIAGDSLLVYWQQLNATGSDFSTDSIMNYRKVASGTTTIARRWAFSDSGWPYAYDAGYGWNAWNGRMMENDGANLWTSDADNNILIRRDPNGKIIEMVPGPAAASDIGCYGVAYESANSAGQVYYPNGGAGSPAFVPYAKGTKHYLYTAGLSEGKIYKLDVTTFLIPTPPDSTRAEVITATSNRVIIKKSNANQQKVAKYIIYRRDDALTPVAADSIGFKNTSRVAGLVASVDTFIDVTAKNSKASHYYSVLSVNYSGYGEWGASVSSPIVAIELGSFNYSTNDYSVLLNWSTYSETNSLKWEIQRSTDGINYQKVGTVIAGGTLSSGASYSYTDIVPAAGIYYYNLYEISTTNNSKLVHSEQIIVGKMPVKYELAQSYPNPVGRSSAWINFALKNPGKTTLKVYNVLGEETKAIIDGEYLNAGFYSSKYTWDGTDNKGKPVSNGIYFYKLISGEFQSTKKLTVLK